MLIGGISFAVWKYSFTGGLNSLSTAETELEFLESNNKIISLTNAAPMLDETGKTGGEKFDFQVRTKAPYDTSISYDLILEKLEVDSGKTALKNNEVKVYIEDFQGNVVLAPTKLSELNNYKLVSKTNNHSSTNKEIINKYRLRVWLDKDVDIFDNQNKQIKFRININKYPETTDKNQIVLTYDSNGGEGCTKTTVTYNEAYGQLCTPTRENYDFLGWYTAKEGGTKVTSTTKATYDYLYAHWKANSAKVDVVVHNGIVVGNSSKYVKFNESTTFNLKPDVNDAEATVTCTNDQTGSITNNILTVSNVAKDTICTVKYITEMTTLYADGTLIINENLANRSSNITKHGAVTNEYDAMSSSNSYVMSSYSAQPWANERDNITRIEIDNEIHPTSTANWFHSLRNVSYGDFTNLKTESVTSMYKMFSSLGYNSSSTTFELIGLDNLDTSSVTSMNYMFGNYYFNSSRSSYGVGYNATTWSIGNLSGWDTSSVTNMSDMFSGAGSSATTWTIGDLSGWDTSKVTDMSWMFGYVGKSATTWNIGDLSGWDTSSVTNMSSMFNGAGYKATTWTIGDLSGWDTSSVTAMFQMFNYAGYSATTWNIGDLSGWDTSSVTNMSGMFDFAGYRATTFDIGDLSGWNTSSVTNMSYMFRFAGYRSTTFDIGDLSGWNTSSVKDINAMFLYAGYSATTFDIGDLSGWNVSKVTNMNSMFQGAGHNATTFDIGDLSSWDTSSVTNMRQMFESAGYNVITFTIGDISSWNTSSVTNMSWMFAAAGESATWSLDCSGWNVNLVTSYTNFNYGVTSKVTAPTWVN